MSFERFQNLPPIAKAALVVFGVVFGVFWVWMIANTAMGGAEAKRQADVQRARFEAQMEIERAVQDAKGDFRINF